MHKTSKSKKGEGSYVSVADSFHDNKGDLRVMEVLIGFAHAWDAKHKIRKDPRNIDRVRWREPQQCLQIKRIQLAYQELLSQATKNKEITRQSSKIPLLHHVQLKNKVDQAH